MDKSAVRVGHGGTLDVEAAGVLVLGINHGCKKLHGYLQGGKSYLAMGRLGVATDSYDAEGKVTKIAPTEGITAHGMEELLAEFTGEIMQRPPIYSAIRVDGMRLYQYARAGNKVPTDIKARKVNVKNIRLLHFANPQAGAEFGTPVALPEKFLEYFVTDRYAWVDGCPEMQEGMLMTPYVNQPDTASFQILIQSGGGGVYVRSLVHDIGERLGSAATMTSLLRTSQGPLRLDRDTIEIEDLVYVDRVRDAIAHAENVIRAAGAERS
ncbi:pseudouridine synthase pus4 [Linderina pennispora]|nr:pseudouridine synthase pus4 [Linderina pennispora]